MFIVLHLMEVTVNYSILHSAFYWADFTDYFDVTKYQPLPKEIYTLLNMDGPDKYNIC